MTQEKFSAVMGLLVPQIVHLIAEKSADRNGGLCRLLSLSGLVLEEERPRCGI